jgi:hypothetical protein
MFEEQITESIEAGAPDITYSGNEGPKSPQQEQMMQQQMMEQQMMEQEQQMMAPVDYSSPAFRIQLIEKLMADEGLDYGAASQKADWIIAKNSRQGAAFGGIMGLDGRRQYGLGSKLKKFVRNIIPNEISEIAVKAAPFVAPFNPIAAGLMAGIGGFDQTGRIGSSIKSGLMNYGMGQAGRYLGGADFQTGFNPAGGFTPGTTGSGTFSKYFSKPTGDGGIKDLFNKSTPITNNSTSTIGVNEPNSIEGFLTKDAAKAKGLEGARIAEGAEKAFIKNNQAKNLTLLDKFKQSPYVPKSFSALNPLSKSFDLKQAAGAAGILTLGTKLLGGGPEETINTIMSRGDGYDMDDIRTRVTAAYKDPSGKLLQDLRIEFPYLGTAASKNTAIMADGGRIRRAEGGIMDLGGMELDYRAEGGFVPIGAKEKADDVPARLSVNEFVFTADAVRNAGGGDIDQGAEIMERVMKNLEQGGQLSEESQGMQGARDMFQTSQRLGEVV